MIHKVIAATVLFGVCVATFAADGGRPAPDPANAGKAVFRAQCALCHSAEPNDNGGAQGPSLQGIVGTVAGAAPGFSYTPALKNSRITWNAATLDRFLAAPTVVVPGTMMVLPVDSDTDRRNLVAYFSALKDGTFREPAARGFGGPPPGGPPRAAAAPTKGSADWMNDRPGRVHRIDLDKLPPPFDTPSASNFPSLVPQPAGAKLALPAGFEVEVFLKDLSGPRTMKLAPNGDILLVETTVGRVKVLRPSADGKTATPTVFAQGLLQPYGLAFYPAGPNPQWLYVAEMNRVVRYAYKPGQTVASGVPEVVIPQLSPVGGGHYTRDIVFSPDGKRMYVSVGSGSNVQEDMPKKSAAEIREWEAAHGLGAAWGTEENRAGVRVFEVGNEKAGRTFATGIRNCVTLTMQPANGELWCTTNERDMLGDDLVPDYSTRVREGKFYGWPWYYMGDNVDPRHADARPDLKGKVTRPDVPYQAHSAATGLVFYPQRPAGASAFPAEYAGEGFAVLHGSWNRAFRTGHKIVRMPMKNGVPTGEYIDFMTGFITDDGNAWGRPVAIAVAADGSLLLSDDGANVIYRIAYKGAK
ncbi:MAG: PQQ-dependent sugar dehydrogenase [Nevskiaceae bacterium]|nr:PQQ-dependent sugar dehydrogenase [Nevskiaceae bacterium]